MGNKFNVAYALIRFPHFENPATSPALSPQHCVYFLLQLLLRSTQTLFCIRHNKHCTLQYTWYITQTHAGGSGQDGGGAVAYRNKRLPEVCPRPEAGLVRLAGCNEGGTERARDRKRPKHRSISMSLSLAVTTEWRSWWFWNIKREKKSMEWVITLTLLHKSNKKINIAFSKTSASRQTWGFDVAYKSLEMSEVAARSNAWACGRSLAGAVGSNPAKGKYVCLSCCMLSGWGLCIGLITRTE